MDGLKCADKASPGEPPAGWLLINREYHGIRGPVAWLLVLALLCIGSAGHSRTLNGFDLDGAMVPVQEIVSGGPPRDGIPAINNPRFLNAAAAGFLDDDDRILGVELGGQAKAYPIAILNWHEVVNDRSGQQHFVVSYCPLCGTGMVFGSNFGDGALVFGVSGLLYNSDVLLFDRNTESLWSQILGQAISGPLIRSELPQLPAFHTTWKAWRARYPETLVLSTDTGYRRDYGRNPYQGYERSRRLYFDVTHRAPRGRHPKALVMGVEQNGVYKAYPFEELKKLGLERFEDRVGETPLVVHWDPEASSAHVTDSAGVPLPSTIGFWFAWYAFHPDTRVFEAPKDP